MIRTAKSYDYPFGGQCNETVATLEDDRVVTVNTQYAVVAPHGQHAADCDQINKMGGRCTCGLLDGIDVVALVADARERGRFGRAPVAPQPETTERPEWRSPRGLTLSQEMNRPDSDY